MAPDSSNTKKTLFWFTNRAGTGAIAGVATWAFVTWLRLRCGPFVKDHEAVASIAAIAIAVVAAQPAWKWLGSAGRALRHGLLDRCIWIASGIAAGFVCLLTPAWGSVAAVAGGLAFPLVLRKIGRAAHRKDPQADPERPISRWEDDWLGRGDAVSALAAAVYQSGETVIALLGALGSGKSSVLRLLKAELEKKNPPPIIATFSAWLPSRPEGLARDLTESIESAVRERYWSPALARGTRAFAEALGAARPWIGAALGVLRNADQQKRLDDLAAALGRLPQKVVVLVDEIDRMDRPELEELFKVVRGAPDLENICFVCALDPEHAARTIAGPRAKATAIANARQYLGKFFACRFDLPMPAEEKMQAALAERIENVLSKRPETVGKEALTKAIGPTRLPGWTFYGRIITTPRRLKALVKAFESSLMCTKGGLNAVDLLNLCLLRELDYALPAAICEKREILVDRGLRSLTDSAVEVREILDDDEKTVQARLDEFMRALSQKPSGDQVVALMVLLFPNCEASARRLGLPKPLQPIGGDGEKDRRFYHPRFFMRYFTLAIPGSQYPESDLENLLVQLKDAAPGEVDGVLSQAVKSAGGADSTKSWDMLMKLGDSIGQLPLAKLPLVARAAATLAPNLAEGVIWGPRTTALRLVFSAAAAASKTSIGEAQKLLEEVIGKTDEFTAVRIARRAIAEDRRPELQGIDASAVKAKFVSTMDTRYGAGTAPSLLDRFENCLPVLYAWAEWAPPGATAAADYLERELRERPARLATLGPWLGMDCQQKVGALTTIYGDRLPLVKERLRRLVSDEAAFAGLPQTDKEALKSLQSCFDTAADAAGA